MNYKVIFDTVDGTTTVGVMGRDLLDKLVCELADNGWRKTHKFSDGYLEFSADDPDVPEYGVWFRVYKTEEAVNLSAEEVEDWIDDIPSLGCV